MKRTSSLFIVTFADLHGLTLKPTHVRLRLLQNCTDICGTRKKVLKESCGLPEAQAPEPLLADVTFIVAMAKVLNRSRERLDNEGPVGYIQCDSQECLSYAQSSELPASVPLYDALYIDYTLVPIFGFADELIGKVQQAVDICVYIFRMYNLI
jgi:hypothetical protein